MKARILKLPALLVMALACALPLGAYTFLSYHWSAQAAASGIVMHLQLGSNPPLTDGASSWNQVAASALSQWNSHLDRFQFTIVQNSSIPIAQQDGKNSVFFAPTIFGASFGPSTLAVATTWTTGGIRTEADVVFNSAKSWDSYRGNLKAGGVMDFRRVALHEFGHVLGLNHPDEAGQTVTAQMNSAIGNGDDLAQDDIAGGQALWGATSSTPLTITTTPASGVTDNFAVSGGTVSGGGSEAPTEVGVVYSTTQNPAIGSGTKVASGSGAGSFISNLVNLTPTTTYYVRAYAIHGGDTAYGGEISFTTTVVQSPPTVTTKAATNITYDSVSTGGVVTSDGGSVVTLRGVVYSTSPNPILETAQSFQAGWGVGAYTFTLSPLIADTTYYVRAFAQNSVGRTYGAQVSFRTHQAPDLPDVTTSQASGVTGSSATLGGDVTGVPGGTISEKGVVFRPFFGATTPPPTIENGTRVTANPPVAGTGLFTSTVTGLNPGTTYYFRAYAVSFARFVYGPPILFTTGEARGYRWTNFVGQPGSGGSIDGTGTDARIGSVFSTALDAAGNLYFTDGNAIRKVTPGGVVTTIAGDFSTSGSADGTGTAARFFSPRGVTVDAAGNLYIADTINYTIRKMTPAGVVTTLAGLARTSGSTDGVGTAARFNEPWGLAMDGLGNLYIADNSNHTLRKMTPAGVVTTLAGLAGSSGSNEGTGSAARFYNPQGVAVDTSGNIYVSETGNHRILKVTPAGVMTRFIGGAGSGKTDGAGTAARFYHPEGLAVDGSGNIYVAETGNHTIRQVTPAGVVTTLGGFPGVPGSVDGLGTEAKFNYPHAVAVAADGSLFVADRVNYRISRGVPEVTVSSTPIVQNQTLTNLSGAQHAPAYFVLDAPAGLAFLKVEIFGGTGDCDLYVRDDFFPTPNTYDQRPRLDGNQETVLAEHPQEGPYYIMLRGFTSYAGVSLRVSYSATPVAPVAITTPPLAVDHHSATVGGNVSFGGGTDVLERGVVYATHQNLTVGTAMKWVSGSGKGEFSGSLAGLAPATTYYLRAYASNNEGTAYGSIMSFTTNSEVYDWSNFAGMPETYGNSEGTGSAARFNMPGGLTMDTGGSLYVADRLNHRIRKVTPTGEVSLWVGLNQGSNNGTASQATFYAPKDVAVDEEGNLYVADTGNHRIRKVTPARVVTTLAGSYRGSLDGTGTAARFDTPEGVVVGPGGVVYVADTRNHTIRKITPTGVVTTFAGLAGSGGSADGTGTAARFYFPQGLAVDAGGTLYVADVGNHTIRKITVTGMVSTVAGLAGTSGATDGWVSDARFKYPIHIAVDEEGNLYVSDYDNSTLRKVSPNGWVSTLGGYPGVIASLDGLGTQARFRHPMGVALAADGTLFVADMSSSRIIRGVPEGVTLPSLPTVSTSAASGVTYQSAESGGQVTDDGGGSVVERGVVYGTGQNPTTGTGIKVVSGSGLGAFTSSLTSLNPGTTYYLRAYAMNSAGPAYGAQVSFTTPVRPATLPVVVTGEVFPEASNYALVHGVLADTGGAAITDRGVVWSTSELPTVDTGTKVAATPQGTSFQVSIHGLQAGATYFVRTYAVNSAGTAYGPQQMFSTPPLPDPTTNYSWDNFAGEPQLSGNQDGTGAAALLASPRGLTVDTAGNLYVSDMESRTVRKISPAGKVTTLAGRPWATKAVNGTGGTAGFGNIHGLGVDAAGNIYVADTDNHAIRKITPKGVVSTLAGSLGQSGDRDGTGSAARFFEPFGVAVDATGHIYVADSGNAKIRKISPAGKVTTIAGEGGQWGSQDGPGQTARFNSPHGLAISSQDEVFVADYGNNKIRKITATGEVSTFAGSGVQGHADGQTGAASFHGPSGLAFDPDGNLLVTEFANTIRKITPGGMVTRIGGAPYDFGSTQGIGSMARFSGPYGIAVRGDGCVFVVDTYNSRIARGHNGADPADSLSVTPGEALLSSRGGAGNFTVTASGLWYWSSDVGTWLTSREPTPQTGDQVFEFFAAAHTKTGERVDTVQVISGFQSQTFTIRQAGLDRRHELALERGVPTAMESTPDKAGTVAMTAVKATPLTRTAGTQTSSVPYGAIVKLTATAKAGHLFSHWEELPSGAVVAGNVVTFPMPAWDVPLVRAVFVANPFPSRLNGGGAVALKGLLWTQPWAVDGIGTMGQVNASLNAATGSLSGKVLVEGRRWPFTGVIFGDDSVWFKTGASLTSQCALSGRVLDLRWSEADGGLAITLGIPEEPDRDGAGTALPPFYGKLNPVSQDLLGVLPGKPGVYTVALSSATQQPILARHLYPVGTGYSCLNMKANGTLSLVGQLADGAKITATTFLTGSHAAPIFIQLPTPGASSRLGAMLGTFAFSPEGQEQDDVTSPDIRWFRPPVTETTNAATLPYTEGWPGGIILQTAGAKYHSHLTVETALDLPAVGQGGNARLQFSGGRLTGVGQWLFDVNGNKVIKLEPAAGTCTLSVNSTTGLFKGAFTPSWINPAKTRPAYQGILIQRGTFKGARGFFLSNQMGDKDPESGKVELVPP